MHYFKIKNVLLTLACVILVGNFYSQDSVYVFKIKKPISTLEFSYKDTFLVKGEHYLMSIKVKEGKKRVVRVYSDSIYISRFSRGVYSVKIPRKSKITKGLIQVYVKNEDGTSELGEIKIFKIVNPPIPQIYIGNIKADSLIDKRYLYDYAKLNARSEGKYVKILSFDLVTFSDRDKKSYHSNSNALTIAMKNHVQRLEVGSILYFNNVNCLMPNGKVEVVKSTRVFFDETNKYKVGERIIYRN